MRKILLALLRTAGTLALLAFGLHLLNTERLLATLRHADTGLLALGLVLMLGGLAGALLRFHAVVAALGGIYGVRDGWKLYAGGHGLNQLLPTGLGGDALRLVLLRRHLGRAGAVQAIVLDRVLGLYHLFMQGLVLLVAAVVLYPDVHMAGMLKVVAPLALGALAGFVLLAQPFMQRAVQRVWPAAVPYAVACTCVFASARVHWLSVVAQLLFSGAFVLVGLAVADDGSRWNGLAYLALVPAIFVLMQVPVSLGGWGMREAAAVALLPLAGMSAEAAFANALLYGVLLLLTGLFGLVIWGFNPKVGPTETEHEPASRIIAAPAAKPSAD